MTATVPYGSWQSPITSDLIVAETIGLATVLTDGADIYWIEARPGEDGRNVLVRRTPDGGTADVTRAPISVRTRVHEYGGGAATVRDGMAWFSNFADQRLYRQPVGGTPEPVTPAGEAGGSSYRYADGQIDPARQRWIGVREAHAADGAVHNTLVAVEPERGGPGRVLAKGHDFYAAPRLSPDGKRLAWVSWDHPNMPWTGTELWVAAFAEDGGIAASRKLAGGPRESVTQPQWGPDGALYFISDRSGWWNLYRIDVQAGGAARPLSPRKAEFAGAQWVFGQSSYAFLDPGRLVCSYGEGGRTVLAVLDIATGAPTPIPAPYTEFGSIRVAAGRIVCVAGTPTGPSAVVAIDPAAGAAETLRLASAGAADPALRRYFAAPQQLEFPTENGLTAFACYYPPTNPDHAPPPGEKPPLVVKCRGGATPPPSSRSGSAARSGLPNPGRRSPAPTTGRHG